MTHEHEPGVCAHGAGPCQHNDPRPGAECPHWQAVGTTGWTIRCTGPRTAQAANRYGWNDNAIRYDDGRIAYDYPERVPLYVRRAVARMLTAK